MKFKCCKHLLHSMTFMLKNIKTCNELNGGEIFYSYDKEKQPPDCDDMMRRRNQIIENCKKGIYPEVCSDCPQFVEDDWEDNQQITKLSLFHWLHCNCECEYCFQAPYRKKFTDKVQKSKYFDAYPIVKDLHEKGYLAPADKFEFEIGGGEVAILSEFPQLMDVMLEHGFFYCYVMSSGIAYSETIAKMLQTPKTRFSVTISSGSREVFKRIKKRDKFEQVKENLRKYISQAVDKNNIGVRYIIDEGYNDTEQDIKDWLDTCEEIGATSLEICLDFCRGFEKKKGEPYSPKLKELVDYFVRECEERNKNERRFYYSIDRTSQMILDRGHY